MNPKTIDFRPVDPLYNKIDAIQAVRVFTRDVLGIPLGLKESKDFVDNLVGLQVRIQTKQTLHNALISARAAGLTTKEMQEIVDGAM